MQTFLSRLEAALNNPINNRGLDRSHLIVARSDLVELIFHFKRLDEELRNRYQLIQMTQVSNDPNVINFHEAKERHREKDHKV